MVVPGNRCGWSRILTGCGDHLSLTGSSMLRTARARTALVVALALCAAGLVIGPAQASTVTTVTGHVETTTSAPLRGVIVYAFSGSTIVQFHGTDENGDIGTPS